MAKDNTKETDAPTVEAPKGIRPKELADELGIDPKTLRARLRRLFPRDASAKNTSWLITEEMKAQVVASMADDEDDEDSDES